MTDPVQVSDHAVLRYLERAGGFEIEALRQAIAGRVARTVLPGAHSVVIDGLRYLVRKGPDGVVVVTVVPLGHSAINQMAGHVS